MPKSDFERILFDSDRMSMAKVRSLLDRLIVQKQRWIGSFHPDSRIRAEAFRASGVEVGRDVFISMGLVVLDGYKPIVRIGDRVAFGNYVSLVAASAPNDSLLREHPEVLRSCIKTLPITIEKDAWVGTGAVILPGVTVGERAILGAGCVVTKDVPRRSIVAGVPARLVRKINNRPQRG